MSVKPTDIGNLDDFNESDEEEDKKSVTATGRQAHTNTLLLPSLLCESFPLIECHIFPFLCTLAVASALLSSIFWLLQLFHALLLAPIAPLPLRLISWNPLDRLFQLQVAPSHPFFYLFLMNQWKQGVNKSTLSLPVSVNGRLPFTVFHTLMSFAQQPFPHDQKCFCMLHDSHLDFSAAENHVMIDYSVWSMFRGIESCSRNMEDWHTSCNSMFMSFSVIPSFI